MKSSWMSRNKKVIQRGIAEQSEGKHFSILQAADTTNMPIYPTVRVSFWFIVDYYLESEMDFTFILLIIVSLYSQLIHGIHKLVNIPVHNSNLLHSNLPWEEK